jgi:hypothetical protein
MAAATYHHSRSRAAFLPVDTVAAERLNFARALIEVLDGRATDRDGGGRSG